MTAALTRVVGGCTFIMRVDEEGGMGGGGGGGREIGVVGRERRGAAPRCFLRFARRYSVAALQRRVGGGARRG
jgi:hypothetical protein